MQKQEIFNRILNKFAGVFPDAWYLKLKFFIRLGYPLNLSNPQSFNEKMQWLKLYDKHSEYTTMVDKIEAKKYVAQIIGDEYIIPTLAVWNSVDEIQFEKLPRRFVLKCSHDSGGIVVCKDKDLLDIALAKKKIKESLGKNYFRYNKEYPYKNLMPRILAEQYMEDESGELRDYKFFCFNGVPRFFKIDFDRYVDHHANYFDIEGKLLPFGEEDYPPIPERLLHIPENLAQMATLAARLSHGIPFVRVDLYNLSGKIYFGELTFFPASGMGKFIPSEWDRKLGDMIILPNISKQK